MVEQDKNAFAYVIYEKSQAEPGKWIRSVMFYAHDPAHSDRDAAWEYNVGWRDPENIRVVPLYDEDGNVARRDDALEAINAQYQADTAIQVTRRSLGDAVEWALESVPPELDEFEGLIRTLEAFDGQVTDQLTIPAHTVTRRDYLPSVEQLEALAIAKAESDAAEHDPDETVPIHW